MLLQLGEAEVLMSVKSLFVALMTERMAMKSDCGKRGERSNLYCLREKLEGCCFSRSGMLGRVSVDVKGELGRESFPENG